MYVSVWFIHLYKLFFDMMILHSLSPNAASKSGIGAMCSDDYITVSICWTYIYTYIHIYNMVWTLVVNVY